MEYFLHLFLLFITYSILGWIIESTYCSIMESKLINRGFLIGPYCPIYGAAATLIIIFLSKYKNDILILFLLSIILSGIIEYATSYILEKIFKLSLWDYSKHKFNLNGRIYLKNLLLFGILAVVVIKIIDPVVEDIYSSIPSLILFVILIITLITFTIDIILTVIAVLDIRKLANKTLNLDELTIVRNNVVKNVQHEVESRSENIMLDIERKGETLKQSIEIKSKNLQDSFNITNSYIREKTKNARKIKLNFIHKRFIKAFPNIKPLGDNKSFNQLKNKLFNK